MLAAPVSYPPAVIPASAAPTFGGTGPWSPAVQTGRKENLTYYGIGGLKVQGLNDNYALQTRAFAFDVLLILCSTNDENVVPGDGYGPGSAFDVSMHTYLDQVHTDYPSAKIIWSSVQPRVELWTATGPHYNDGQDTWVGDVTKQAALSARSSYCLYHNFIADCLTQTVTYNTPAPGISPAYPTLVNGVTYDQLHGSPATKVTWANGIMTLLSFS